MRDDREQIVEVVRQAISELTYRFELLRLKQRALGFGKGAF